MYVADDLLHLLRGSGREATPMRSKAGGLSLDLRAEPRLLQCPLELIEDCLLGRREGGGGVYAVASEMLASMRAPYLDWMPHGEEGRQLASRTAGNHHQMDRR